MAGVGGLYNYGCEAIVRGTVRMLREQWPGCEITYATPQVARDRNILQDLSNLAVIQSHQRWTIE